MRQLWSAAAFVGALCELHRSYAEVGVGLHSRDLGRGDVAERIPRTAATQCGSSEREVILASLLDGLFAEGSMPAGSVLDVGANLGDTACAYAAKLPHRTVHAIDPLQKNIEHIVSLYGNRSNLRTLRAGLGSHDHERTIAQPTGTMVNLRASDKEQAASPDGSIASLKLRILTMDTVFSRERLGFAHIDVEGLELEVLKGGTATLARDRPVFTTEVHVHLDPNYTTALLAYTAAMDYSAFMVDEPCGARSDCRNVLHLPGERRASLLESPALNLAISSRSLVSVDSQSIHRHAFPCCRTGGACCPHPAPPRVHCCGERNVAHWLTETSEGRSYSARRPLSGTRWTDGAKRTLAWAAKEQRTHV